MNSEETIARSPVPSDDCRFGIDEPAWTGISDSCRDYIGKRLVLAFVGGWGWSLDNTSYKHEPDVSGTLVEIIPFQFFDDGCPTRGFIGRVDSPEHLLHGMRVAAFPMSDGLDWDFADNCSAQWRFWFGDGQLWCPLNAYPTMLGDCVIGGYGMVAANRSYLEPWVSPYRVHFSPPRKC